MSKEIRGITQVQKNIISNIAMMNAANPRPNNTDSFINIYYGSEENMKALIPSSLNCEVPDGLTNHLLNKFRDRRIPVFLGMLAEIENNPNVTLDELVDITSEAGIQAKRAAAETLKRFLPQTRPDGSHEFDYNSFVRFFYRNTKKVNEMMYNLANQMENQSLSERNRLAKKYWMLTDGLFDGYNQEFYNTGFLTKELYENIDYKSLVAKNQGFLIYNNTNINSVNSMEALDPNSFTTDLIRTADVSFLLGPLSYASRREIKKALDEGRKEHPDGEFIKSKLNSSISTYPNGMIDFENNDIGYLKYLTGLERMALAVDPELMSKIHVNFISPGEGDKSYSLSYIDNDNHEFSLMNSGDSSEYSAINIAKLKTEIYQVLSKERYALLEDDYKQRINNYLNSSEAQKVALIQCEETRDDVDELYQEMRNGIADNASVLSEYAALMDSVEELRNSYDAIITNPSEVTRERLEKALNNVTKACYTYEDYCKSDVRNNPTRTARVRLNARALALVNKYKNKRDDLEVVIAAQYQAERNRISEQLKAQRREYVIPVEGLVLNLVRPANLTNDEYKAAIIGAFLDDDVVNALGLEINENELRDEKTWSHILSKIANGDINAEDPAFALAREKVIQAIDAFKNGNKEYINRYIKKYVDASIRLYDKKQEYNATEQTRAIRKDMLDTASHIVKTDAYKGITTLSDSIVKRSQISNNVNSIYDEGVQGASNVLENRIGLGDARSEAILSMLSAAYVKLKGRSEINANSQNEMLYLNNELDKRNITLSPAINNNRNLAGISRMINNIYENTHYGALEANFATKEIKDSFIRHLHVQIKRTGLYDLLMRNDKALEDLAINGENAEILTGRNLETLTNIGYYFTPDDINSKPYDAEYTARVNEMWPKVYSAVNLKQKLVDIANSEIETRPAVDFSKPLFAQYAGHIAKSLSDNKNVIIENGYSEEKLNNLISKIEDYERLTKHLSDPKSEILHRREKYKSALSEIEVMYKDLYQVKADIADSPLDLIRFDYECFDKFAAAIHGGDRRPVEQIYHDAIGEYNSKMLMKQFGDEMSMAYMSNYTYSAVSEIVNNLKENRFDKEHKEEYQNVLKGAEQLQTIVSDIIRKEHGETISLDAFRSYLDAVEGFSEKVDKYITASLNSNAPGRPLVVKIQDFLDATNARLNRISKLVNREQVFEKVVSKQKAKDDITEKSYEISSYNIAKCKDYKNEFARKTDNFYQVFAAHKQPGEGWIGSYSNKYMNAESDYNPALLQGYTEKELALLAGIINLSSSFHNKTELEMMTFFGISYSNIFSERTGASGDEDLGEMAEKTRREMNHFLTEMSNNNYESIAKYFREGIKVMAANLTSNDYCAMNSSLAVQLRLGKDVVDLLNAHPELNAICTRKVKGDPEIPDRFMNTLRDAHTFGNVMDSFRESYDRLGAYLSENRENLTINIDTNSQIARDLTVVYAYNRLTNKGTIERTQAFANAEKIEYKNIPALQAEVDAAGNRKDIASLELQTFTANKQQLIAKGRYTEEQANQHEEILRNNLEKGERELQTAIDNLSNNYNIIPVKYDLYPDSFKNMDNARFNELIDEAKATLFGDKETVNISVQKIMGISSIKFDYLEKTFKDIAVEPASFRQSSVEQYYNRTREAFAAAKLLVTNRSQAEAIDNFIQKFDYVSKRLKKLQEPLKDGSHIRFTKDMERGLINALSELKTASRRTVEALNGNDYVTSHLNRIIKSANQKVSEAIIQDLSAIGKGTLYGITEVRNVRRIINDISAIKTSLANTKSFGDGSSTEFKDLLKSISELEKEKLRIKRTNTGERALVNKLENVSKSIKEYLRHKRIKDNNSSTSQKRKQFVNSLKDYIDGILPDIKKETAANSYRNRIAKLGYGTDKLSIFTKLAPQLDKKRAEIENLNNDPYKKVSELALAARENIAELVMNGMPRQGYDVNSPQYEQLKRNVATIILEKRIQLERIAEKGLVHENNANIGKNVSPVFINKLRQKDDNDEIVIQPKDKPVNNNNDDYDEIDNSFAYDNQNEELELEEPNENIQPEKINVYDSLINQIVDYNMINNNSLKPENIYKLLTNESGVVDELYMNSLNRVVENNNHQHHKANEAEKEINNSLSENKNLDL